MIIKEIESKSILRKHKKIDSWFISHYGMNLYRGCSHNCVYCDGRSESYYVDEQFGEVITVKVNAIDILHRELDPKRKRNPFKRSFIMMGGGVGDSYQPLDSSYQLARKALEVIYEYNFPVHLLTKSTLVTRDIDILKRINQQNKAIVSFSFSSADNKISSMVEPGVPLPDKRLEAIRFLKREGISCGMFLLPVIPYITDKPELIEDTIKKASEAGVDFVIFGGMTLKTGIQKDYFMNFIESHYPELAKKYQDIYHDNKWGEQVNYYSNSINKIFSSLSKKYKIPGRIPPSLYKDSLGENDLVVVILEHIDYLIRLEGKSSPFGYAAYSISQIREPLSGIKGELCRIKGIGETTERLILEILETGTSAYYQRLLR